MIELAKRIWKLEQARSASRPRTTGWATLHANLRLVYGDGQRYTPEELARLDSVPPPSGEQFAELWRQAQTLNKRDTDEPQP